MKNIPVDSYIEESPKWEDLSIPEKAEMMKVAIRNGITSLPEIKQAYKEFAEGGNLYKGGGKKRQASFGNAGSQRAMQYFMNKGLTQAQAAGLVGNLMRESGMQSTALNSSSKAFGIAQWLGPRKKALFARYGSNPTLDQQLDFVWHELNTTHRNGLRHLKASKTAAEAARNVMGYYEFSAGPEAAIAAMNRTGQAGNKSMLRGIEYASKLLGIPVSAEDYTPAVQENPLAPPVSDAQQMIQFTPWNPQAFYGYQAPQIEIPMEQPVQNIPTFTKEDVERAQRQQGMETFMALSNLLQPTGTPEAVVPRQRNNPYVAYQEGGNLFKEGGPKASSERIYDVLPRLYAMDGVNVTLSSGNRPGSVVIENGKKTNRKSRHASGMAADIVPGRGSTFADMFRVLRDPNSNVSRYLQSVGGGYLDETSATGTTKYWHDHDRDHSHIHHQIGGYAGANYGKEMASILGGKAPMSTPSTQEQSTFLAFEPANPMAFFDPAAFQTPVIERPVVEPLVEEADVYSQKMQEIEDRRNNLNKLNMMLSLTSPSQSGNSLMSTIGMLTGNYSANGGPIHIKPSHRGRLTELKERTGKTEAELKHDGNPAHKKMVVFAENARKWHGLGGNLYDDGGLTDQQYYSIMEKVAEENNPKWNKFRIEEGGRPLSVDEDYMRILNDNSYDYRGYYNKYPNSAANADTHWNDEFKTAWHPSFSDQSIYSGRKSQYNPKGIVGGHWYGKNEDIFIPTIPQLVEQNKSYFGLGGHIYDGLTEGSQQMETGKDYWSQLVNRPTWLDTFITPVNGGQLSEVVVKPTNDESWLFSLGRYARNGRKPLADSHARKVVANYLSRFDNESAKDYNARISRLADTLDIRGVQFIKNNVESGKLKNRAHYDTKSNTAYIDDMQDIFAEVAHPWQDAMGNNSMNDEYKMGNYDPDIDSRGGTRYAYPDTFEGETHGFFQPAITEWVETGKIGRSLPLLNENLSNEKISPKDNMEVLDSAASWNKQAVDKRLLANPYQLPLTKRIQYSIWDYPLLDKKIEFKNLPLFNKKKALGGNLYDGITEPTQQMDNSYSYIKPLSEVIVDNEGNVRDPEVPSARGTIQLPEVTVSMRDPRKYVSAFEGHQDWLRPMADFVPFVGDALQAKDAAVDAVNGDYLNAGIGAGLLLLPNVIEKPLKYIGKGVKRLWKATDSKLDDIYRLSPEQWTPEQWTAAQDAAIARGDMAEAQRLRDLHFKVSAPDTKVVDINGNPQLVIHKTPNDFTIFDNSRSIGNLNWAATPKAFEGENGVFATGAGTNPKEMRLYINMKNPHYPTIDEGMEPAFINEGEDGILGIVDKDMTNYFKSSSEAGEGFNMSLGVDNPYALKSADAITYDKNGVRIPLGERDNFKLNDIRYGLIPFLGLGAAGTLYGKQE